LNSNLEGVGSGYPSDPTTKTWLTENKTDIFGYSSNIARFSWSTIKKIIDDPVKVEWSDDEEEEGKEKETLNRFYFFKDRNLKNTNNI
jgi:ribonuclease H2 subunit A